VHRARRDLSSVVNAANHYNKRGKSTMERENNDEEVLMFDPITGEPINREQEKDDVPEPTSFDPMTGEPIYSKPQEKTEPTGYDPMTGEPIYGDTTTKEKKKLDTGKLPKVLGAVVAAVVVLAIIATVVVKLATPTYMKIISATVKTFDEKPYFVEEALSAFDIVKDKKFTAGVTAEVDDNTYTVESVLAGQKYQLSVAVDGEDVDDFSVLVRLDSDALSLYAPKLSKKVIQYDYNKGVTGYIADELDDDDIKMFNKVLKGMVNTGNGEALKSDLYKVFKNSLKELEFEKLDSDEFEVDGKDVNCKGYRVKITKSYVKSLLNEIKDVMSDRSYSDTIAEVMGYDDFSDLISDMKSEADYMDTVKVSFYIYKNKLASVSITADNETLEVDFKGGDYRIQNIDIKGKDSYYGRYNILKVEGSCAKNKEEFDVTFYNPSGSTIAQGTVEYNKKSGNLEMDFGRSIFQFEGKINSSSSKVEVSIDSVCIDGSRFSPDSLTLYLSDKTKLTSLDSSKTFDVNKADELEWEELGDDIMDGLDDIGLGNFSWYQIYRTISYWW
jgi:hypothetical protein